MTYHGYVHWIVYTYVCLYCVQCVNFLVVSYLTMLCGLLFLSPSELLALYIFNCMIIQIYMSRTLVLLNAGCRLCFIQWCLWMVSLFILLTFVNLFCHNIHSFMIGICNRKCLIKAFHTDATVNVSQLRPFLSDPNLCFMSHHHVVIHIVTRPKILKMFQKENCGSILTLKTCLFIPVNS